MKLKNFLYASVLSAFLFLSFGQTARAQILQEFQKKVTKFNLDNGLTFLVIHRPVAPVISMVSFVNAGAIDEPRGHTGEAHIFEHMAFKGTHDIGTKNWQKEKPVLRKLDQTYQKWLNGKYSPQPDSAKMERLWEKFKKLQKKEETFIKSNQYSKILDRNGVRGMNAQTNCDWTRFFYSLPENRLKLWFSLESDRFTHPVFREFYKEKHVIKEERLKDKTKSLRQLLVRLAAVAFTASPYHHPVIGWKSDITNTTIQDAMEFYNKYYVPSNIVMAIAGDVKAEKVKKLAKKYFGSWETAPEPSRVYTKEPKQQSERSFTMKRQSQPLLAMGYHTVSQNNPDYLPLQLLGDILAKGRTSILYKKMVQGEETALGVNVLTGFPGTKLPSLFLILAAPNQGVGLDTLKTNILGEIQQIKNGKITKEQLDRARTNMRANLIRGLDSNMGIAKQLAQAQAQRGDWRKVFTDIQDLKNITADDLQRVANKYLNKNNLTVGKLVNKPDNTTSPEKN